MNIQIFGTKKCNDTKKAQRYFKERGIKFQFIDMSEKEISKGEFRSVCQAVGGINALINIKYECRFSDIFICDKSYILILSFATVIFTGYFIRIISDGGPRFFLFLALQCNA